MRQSIQHRRRGKRDQLAKLLFSGTAAAERLVHSIAILEGDHPFPVEYPDVIERSSEQDFSDVTRRFFRIAGVCKAEEDLAA
jgi:hypothetical protein